MNVNEVIPQVEQVVPGFEQLDFAERALKLIQDYGVMAVLMVGALLYAVFSVTGRIKDLKQQLADERAEKVELKTMVQTLQGNLSASAEKTREAQQQLLDATYAKMIANLKQEPGDDDGREEGG